MNELEKRKVLNNMALGYVLDKGIEFTSQITDDEIENLDGNGLMTKEFVQDLVRVYRDYAKSGFDNIVINIQQSFYMDDVLNTNRAITIIFDLFGYILDNHLYEFSMHELMKELIEKDYITEDELKIIDETSYDEYKEYYEK